MALKDLIASKASLTEDAIEEIVAEFARFDPDHKAIVFTPESYKLSSKVKKSRSTSVYPAAPCGRS
jgi:hypothetical protein